ncbi:MULTISPECIES: VirB4 family type IV secretion system protein [Vagococcus]|uniref:Putative ATPase TraE n=1 Tax=Vagococcus fluvialis bH819 TaxID=1255619 RepID=A0A1X6WS34_9ENTE|nr:MULTISPECIES: tra protein [Vagococcus]SLM87077.1 putative ATPase TraE [Vagococcus fluvialis bH819]HCM90576.1 tra protein [Vagococcus sp.]
MLATKKQVRTLIEQGYDLNFIEKVQTKGGLKFGERHISTGDGYVSCIAVYEFAEDVNSRWLIDIMGITDTVATLDIATADKEDLLKKINTSIGELDYRSTNENRTTDKTDAVLDKYNLEDFALEITKRGEVVKVVQARIFVYNDSLEELEKKIAEIRKDLGSVNHKAVVPLFRMDQEWQSLFENCSSQEAQIFARKGLTVPAKNIGGGIPFHHKALKDPQGFYLGTTSTGGAFIFDPFYSTQQRRSFNGFILGKMGFGKSTTLKQFQEGLQAKNCFIRGFDKSGEYEEMVRQSGGVYVDLSGGDMTVNPLQVYSTVIDKFGNVDESKSFQNHMTKCSNQLRFLEPDIPNSAIREYKLLLQEFYLETGLLPRTWVTAKDDNERNSLNTNICNLRNEQYPIYEDFLSYMKERQYKLKNPTPERVRDIEMVILIVTDMCVSNPQIFNGITTMPNFDTTKIVYYNIDNISKLDEPVFHCQLFTALTTIWNSALQNGKTQTKLIRDKKIQLQDSLDFMVLIDECHNVINANNKYACKYVLSFQREMRKMRAGVYFATQTPEEIIPKDGSSEVADIIRNIFNLCTFKCFFNLDSALLEDLKKVLKNSVTDTELMLLPNLNVGEAVVQTTGEDTYLVFFDPEKDQLERFNGGE